MAEFSMDKYNGWGFIDGKKIVSPKIVFFDEWMSDIDLKGKTKRTHPVTDKDIAAAYVTEIEEGIEHNKIINKFQGWLICTMNNQEAEDSTSENHTADTRFNYTTDDKQYSSGFDPVFYFSTTCGFIDIDATSDLYNRLLNIVLRH